MKKISNSDEIVEMLGENIKALRLQKNLTMEMLASRAGISLTALRHLEGGSGATVGTLVRVIRALDKLDWLSNIAPKITINPLHMVKSGQRQRARPKKLDHENQKEK